jgi:integrase
MTAAVILLRTPLTASRAPRQARGGCRVCGIPHRGAPCQVLVRHLDWMRMRGQSALYVRDRRNLLRRAAAALPVPLLDATPGHLLGWRQGLICWPSRQPVQPGVVASYVSHLSVFYDWAISDGCREDPNPAAGLPVPRQPRMLPRPIGEAALMDALAAAPPRIRLWLVLAAWAGLRAREIALLRRESILDTASPPVLIVTASATKGNRERVVPLSAFVLAEIARAGLPRSGWCFLRRDGQPGPNTPAMVSALASEHLHDCGISATLHQLRHRCLSQAYRVSKDLRMVQEIAGHASPAQTAGYTRFDDAGAAAAMAALPVPAPAAESVTALPVWPAGRGRSPRTRPSPPACGPGPRD